MISSLTHWLFKVLCVCEFSIFLLLLIVVRENTLCDLNLLKFESCFVA